MNESEIQLLPDGWVELSFEQLLARDKYAMKRGPFGSALKKSFFVSSGYKVYEQKNAIQDDSNLGTYYVDENKYAELEAFRVKPGDFLVSCSGTIGRITQLPKGCKKGIINQALLKIQIDEEVIFDKYFLYFFRSDLFQKKVLKETRGVAIKNIASVKDIKNLKVILPNTALQKRIVAKIEELFSHIDAGIDALNKAKQLLKQYRQSILKAAVTGELTKDWRENMLKDDVQGSTSAAGAGSAGAAKIEPPRELPERILIEPPQKWEEQQLEQFIAKGKTPKNDKWKEKYKELDLVTREELKQLPELPEGWVYTQLGNLIEDPKYGTSKKCTYDSDGLGVLRIPNIANGEVDAADLKFAKFDDQEIATYKLQEGDILIIRSNGSINLVGKCALINETDKEYLYAGYLIRLRPYKTIVSSRYLIQSLNSIYLRRQIEGKAKSTSGVNNINSGELQSLIVPVCSLREQIHAENLVEKKLDSIERLYSEIELDLLRAEKNKQSILASAFSGRLVYDQL